MFGSFDSSTEDSLPLSYHVMLIRSSFVGHDVAFLLGTKDRWLGSRKLTPPFRGRGIEVGRGIRGGALNYSGVHIPFWSTPFGIRFLLEFAAFDRAS